MEMCVFVMVSYVAIPFAALQPQGNQGNNPQYIDWQFLVELHLVEEHVTAYTYAYLLIGNLRIYILTPDLISPKCCILILQHIVSQCHTTWPYDLFSQDNQVQEID